MIKSDKFTISTRNYAFKKGSLRSYNPGNNWYDGWWVMDVFYYKKKDGKIAACFGQVHVIEKTNRLTEKEFIEKYRATYGPNMIASWNGTDFIGTSNYESIVQYVEELRSLLNNYPEIPKGYTEWYKNQ